MGNFSLIDVAEREEADLIVPLANGEPTTLIDALEPGGRHPGQEERSQRPPPWGRASHGACCGLL